MQSGRSILMCGRNSELQRLRRKILERAGYSIFAASSNSEAITMLGTLPVDLLLLCHTLSTNECDELVRFTQDRWPQTKTLALSGIVSGCHDSQPDATYFANEGPDLLLKQIHELLNREPT